MGQVMAVTQNGSRSTTALIISMAKSSRNERYYLTGHTNQKDQIAGYSLYGRRDKKPGGAPDFMLSGHLDNVSCIVPVEGTWDNLQVGNKNDSNNNDVRFFSGGRDGMVLAWGCQRKSLMGGDAVVRDRTSYWEWRSNRRRQILDGNAVD